MTDRHHRSLSTTAVTVGDEIEDEAAGQVEPETDRFGAGDDLYPLALLKIVMAMKKPDPSESVHFEDILDRILDDMVIDRDDFLRYVQRNMARLVTAAREGKY